MISIAALGHLAKENYMVNPSSLGLLLQHASHGFQGQNRYLAHTRGAVIRPWNGKNIQGPWISVQLLKLPLSACQVSQRPTFPKTASWLMRKVRDSLDLLGMGTDRTGHCMVMCMLLWRMILPKEVLLERALSPSSSYSKFIYINYQGDTMHSSTKAKALHRLQNFTFWKEYTCDRCAQPKNKSFRHWPGNKNTKVSYKENHWGKQQ